MSKQSAVLFDLDGVIIDTELQYSMFWKTIEKKYQLGIENFEQLIKGMVFSDILSQHFSHLPKEQQKEIERESHVFDIQLEIKLIPDVLDFLSELKNVNILVGLVTSSNNAKLIPFFQKLPIKHLFNTVVSADRIDFGKPHPMCYLLAAKDLGIDPSNCIVFEDSRNGIKAGNAAGMQVIGLSTTLSAESIQNDCIKVISDFRSFHLPF
ncbi:HAD family hydrolase [Candidatus Azobacteroides pseudotrichonymphae]|uniref:Phosphatase n=1 Tax=Azobacteroides pseudotrichonymphae genomovar. CFP2 TaxID=511995 RepID=B6YQU8_AZOPC|nr:HAD family phosphatase [Candidatus Azobacteroides pseudotrichonymphae]BAG83570.1 putative phosphatase [Candidatus Azobacteroides pseudotrichonymphae genomovar. CFP2]